MNRAAIEGLRARVERDGVFGAREGKELIDAILASDDAPNTEQPPVPEAGHGGDGEDASGGAGVAGV